MKKIYSIILLFSLLTGVLQPVMPMIEFHLFQGDLLELFLEENTHPEEDCDQICCSIVDMSNCQNQKNESSPDLLDGDYYPVPIQLPGNDDRVNLLKQSGLYTTINENYTGQYHCPAPPPPRPVI